MKTPVLGTGSGAQREDYEVQRGQPAPHSGAFSGLGLALCLCTMGLLVHLGSLDEVVYTGGSLLV